MRDESALFDIATAARQIADLIRDQTIESFMSDRKIHLSVQHQLIVMGEATKRVSTAYRELHPDIPWRRIAGIRDVLVHDYDEVNLQEIWKTITISVPEVLELVLRLLPGSQA